MRKWTKKVFDDTFTLTFSAATTATTSVYTPIDIAVELGSVDQLALQLVGDNYSASGSPTAPKVSAAIEVSGDARNFNQKNGSPEVAATAIAAGTTTSAYGADGGTLPSLGHVRVRIDLTTGSAYTGTITLHVKLYATGRDQG